MFKNYTPPFWLYFVYKCVLGITMPLWFIPVLIWDMLEQAIEIVRFEWTKKYESTEEADRLFLDERINRK